MSLRADNITQLSKAPDSFSDFFTDFSKHPVTKELARLRNDQSIKQALRNLILTNYGERLFQPNIGSNIYRSLFEPNDIIAAEDIRYHIETTVRQNEPRVSLLQVEVFSDQVNDSVIINVVFAIISTNQIQSLDVVLRRVR